MSFNNHIYSGGRKQKRAFTLTEIAIVLGVVGVMLGAIWSGAAMVIRKQSITQTVKQVLVVSQNIRGLFPNGFNNQTSNQNITTAVVNAGVFPADAELKLSPSETNPDGSPFYNPMTAFGSPYWVGARTSGDPNQFTISLNLDTISNAASVCAGVIGAMIAGQSDNGPVMVYNGYNTINISSNTDVTSIVPCSEASFTFAVK